MANEMLPFVRWASSGGVLSVVSHSRSVAWLVISALLWSCLWRPSSFSVASAPARPHGSPAERDIGILSSDHSVTGGSRRRRQDVDMDLTEILAGRVDPNCTAEVEMTFICPLFARCFSLERGPICVCGELNDGAVCPGDFDECALGVHICGPGGTCKNLLLGYTCVCHRGYIADSLSSPQCVDIDECQDSQLPCHSAARCLNSVGSFLCECQSGYQGDGFDCVDVDECRMNSLSCHPNAVCQNNAGGFRCICSDGFSGDGLDCVEMRHAGLSKVTSVTASTGLVTSPAFVSAFVSARPVSSLPASGPATAVNHWGKPSGSGSDSSAKAAGSDEDGTDVNHYGRLSGSDSDSSETAASSNKDDSASSNS